MSETMYTAMIMGISHTEDLLDVVSGVKRQDPIKYLTPGVQE